MPRFTEAQTRAVCERIGLPRLTPGAVPARTRVAIDELRRVLDLPEPPCRELLSESLWLGGSTLPRWLTRGVGMGDPRNGDLDFYVPTLEAFHDAGRFLLGRGFTFRTFRSRRRMCQLCGGPAELIGGLEPDVPFLPPLERFRCPDCGDFGGADAAEMTAGRLPRLSAGKLADRGVLALELKAPDGAIVHVSAVNVDPDPVLLCTSMDFSVIHFMLDDQDLHFGRHAWTDLLTGRLRLLNLTNRIENYDRMHKYQRHGFRPYLGTRLKLELRRRIP
jgi:hypothetical protein